MIQAKIFDAIINKDKKLANDIFINERHQLDKVLAKSRLRSLFLELVDLDEASENEFLELRKNTLLRNQIIISDILELSKNLHAFNIHHVFIKGAATLFQINHSRSIRYTSDIDILINIADIEKLHIMLKKIGIKHSFDIFHDYENSKKNHSLESIQLNSGICIDIHFRASSPQDFSLCPYTEKFLYEYHVITIENIKINVSKFDQIYVFSLYQLFIRNEINNCSSSIIDLILIKYLDDDSASAINNLSAESYNLDRFDEWGSLINLNEHNFERSHKDFVLSIFSNPKRNILKRIKLIFLNIIFLRRSIKEKYGVNAKTKKIYIKFLLNKLKN